MANRDKFLSDFSGKFKQERKFKLHEDQRRGRKRKDYRDMQRSWKEMERSGEDEKL